jgi:hypothetical protein
MDSMRKQVVYLSSEGKRESRIESEGLAADE